MTSEDMRRSAFEDKYPPPEGVEWVEELGYYSTKAVELLPQMDTYNEWFDVWVAALHSAEAEKEPDAYMDSWEYKDFQKRGSGTVFSSPKHMGKSVPFYLRAGCNQAEKGSEWLRLEVVGPELGEDIDIRLLDGSILIECQIQTDGDFYCKAIFGEFFVCASNVLQWKPTRLRSPAPPEHKPE